MVSGFETLRVLLVDDNTHMRAIVSAILVGAGVKHVCETADGGEALEALKTFIPAVAIVDLQMEPVDGVEFTRRVRNGSDPRLVRLPIIMMTGHSELRRIVDARDAGVNEIVVKPLTAKAVLSRIEAVTQRPRPFVRTISYFGPDRRRRDDPKFAHLRRRQSDGRRERPDDARASGEIKAP